MEKTWPKQMPLNSAASAVIMKEMSTCVRALKLLTVLSSLSWGQSGVHQAVFDPGCYHQADSDLWIDFQLDRGFLDH